MPPPEPRPDSPAVDLSAFGFDDPQDGWLGRFQSAATTPSLGRFGPYEVLAEAGRGGQGIVYRARHTGMNREVALKRLPDSFGAPQTRKRFEREIQAVVRLNHPAIVTVFAVDLVEGQPVLAMEWIDGAAITAWARHTTQRRTDVPRMLAAVCDAVHHAHQRGVIHRDLKPSNILVDRAGRPHVLDFGLAKIQDVQSGDPGAATRTEHFVGTPAYASPEQVQEQFLEIDIRTDVYSLGVVLYEALTDRTPVPPDGPLVDVLQAIREAPPPRPSSVSATADRELDAIVLKALCKEKDGRYQSMDAFAADLRRYLAGQPVLAHPPSTWYHFRKLAVRHRLPLLVAAASILVIAVLALLAGRSARIAEQARAQERQARLVAERVGEFLGDTLASALPSRGGRDFTVLQALAEAGNRADRELADHPQVAARVHYTIGETYRALWRRREALPHLQQALQLSRALHPEDHEEVARSLAALGSVYTNLRDPQAVALQRQAFDMRRRLYGNEHPRVADSLARLAYALHQAGEAPRWDEAEQLFLEALEMYRRLHGPQHRDVASCLHNLGWMRVRQHRLVEAADLYEQALAVFRAVGDLQDPFYADCLYGYAAQLLKLGRHADSLPILHEAIPLIRRLYGGGAATFLMWECGKAHLELNHLAEALDWHQQALDAVCQALSSEHPHIDALRVLSSAAAARLQDPGAGLPSDELLDALAAVAPEQRATVVTALNHLTGLLIGLGQDDRAAALAERLDDRLLATAGPDSALRVDNMRWRSVMARDRAQPDLAVRHLRAALDILEQASATPDVRWGRLSSELGDCLRVQEQYDEAETCLRAGQAVLEAQWGPAHEQTRRAALRLVQLYEDWDKPDLAAVYRSRFLNAASDERPLSDGHQP